jgi:hypothetical protein
MFRWEHRGMPSLGFHRSPATAVDARTRLLVLEAERLEAVAAGLGSNSLFMADLEHDIAVSRDAFIGRAVTEIATLRAELSAPRVG